MAKKDKERAHARSLYVELGKSQKEISEILGCSEKTVGKWGKEDNWKAARTAKMTSTDTMLANGKLAISNLSDILLDIQKKRAEASALNDKEAVAKLDVSILSISDAIAKTSASVNKFEKANAISLVTYLNVMDEIFKALQNEDPKLHSLTLDFQERHVQDVAKRLG